MTPIPNTYQGLPQGASATELTPNQELLSPEQIASYLNSTYTTLKEERQARKKVWDECWQVYNSIEDYSQKFDWQTRLFFPKAWSSVKQATSFIKRLLTTSPQPWALAPVDQSNQLTIARAAQWTELVQHFMRKANYVESFAEALENSFVMGVGVLKVWWDQTPKKKLSVQPSPEGYKEVVRTSSPEGNLCIKAVDPYNFYWLGGSKFGEWTGTLEESEVPKWQLIEMGKTYGWDLEKIYKLSSKKLDEAQQQSALRFNQTQKNKNSYSPGLECIVLKEYFGPLFSSKGELVERHAHVIMANDSEILFQGKNSSWSEKIRYVAFSPLKVPFRADGKGIVEQVRGLNKAINKLGNLSVDTLLFRLLPVFEVYPDAYENPEDFATGLSPGKIFRRDSAFPGAPGINPIPFEDISGGSVQVAAQLDRAFQEGSLVSEIQQAIPRFRGVQSATEVEYKAQSQDSFFGELASHIEQTAIKPLVELCADTLMQYLPTANDPRVAGILGLEGQALVQGISNEELWEMVVGDYIVQVDGITNQLDKVQSLENLTQFMNILGQNPEAWLPYIKQEVLLRKILECFRPVVKDIDDIIASPEEVEQAKQEAIAQEQAALEAQLQQQQFAQEQAMHQQAVDEKNTQIDQLLRVAEATKEEPEAPTKAKETK